jgi:hypothetical protein
LQSSIYRRPREMMPTTVLHPTSYNLRNEIEMNEKRNIIRNKMEALNS